MGVLDLRRYWTIGLLAAALAPAQTAAAQSGSAPPAAAQTSVKLSLDGRLEGPAAPFLVAQEKGYYRGENLAVTVDEAATALEPITRVAAGGYELGFADINLLMRWRDQNPNAPIKAVFMVYNRPPYAVLGRKSRGVAEPAQLEGKKLGASPAGATFAQWPLFARLNGIDASRVTVENIGIPVRAPMLAAGQLDAVLGFSFRVYIDLKDRGVPLDDIVLMPMANYGLKLYGNAIIANAKFAAEKPEALRGFLAAYLKGLKETVRRPSEAVETILRRADGAKKEVELERLRMAIRDNIVTPQVRADGVGGIDAARFAEAIEQMASVQAFKARPKPEDVFDPAFLPPAAERRMN
jgi:NitT/TauT family transport system substrate-binding protein